jgi:hypothetical protein
MKITKVEQLEDIDNLYALFQNMALCAEEGVIDMVDDVFMDHDDVVQSLEKHCIIDVKDSPKLLEFKFKIDGHDALDLESLLDDYFDNNGIDYDGEYIDNIYAYIMALIVSDYKKYQEVVFNDMLESDEDYKKKDLGQSWEPRVVSNVSDFDIPDDLKFKI